LLLHIGAAYVVPAEGKGYNSIHVLGDYVLPEVPDIPIPLEHHKPECETVDDVACFQCRFKVAMVARYNPHAVKKVLCAPCYETVDDKGEEYKRHLFMNVFERQVMQEVIDRLKGTDHKFMDSEAPAVTALSEAEAPVFDECEIKEGLKFMMEISGDSVKCNNDRGTSNKALATSTKKSRLSAQTWKKYYWSTTVDQIRTHVTEEAIQKVPVDRRNTLRSFREKVERVMQIMAQHPDKDSITQFESGRGVLMLFGGLGTQTPLHLDISGALTYQFRVSTEQPCCKWS
jgi:hypothetical protein